MSRVLPCDLQPVSLSPGSPGTLFPVVPVSPASPPRVSVHCHPGTPLGSPRNWRRAAALLFPTMSLLLGAPSSGGGGGEGGAPAPCLWQRPFGQQCMLGSKLCPLGLHGNASAVPAHLAPTNAQCCHRFAPTGHSASLSPDPGAMARTALSSPASWEHREWTKSA